MKKILIFVYIGIFVIFQGVAVSGPCLKKDKDLTGPFIDTDYMKYENSPINKISRGITNMATCWMEIPAGIFKVAKEKDAFIGVTLGTIEGFCNTILRGLTAAFDTATFIIPPYNRPLMEPEFAADNLKKQSQEYSDLKK